MESIEISAEEFNEYMSSLEKENEALLAQVEHLHSAIEKLHEVASRCDGWEAFPQKALDDACDAMMSTSTQCLQEIKAQAIIDAIDAHKNKLMTFGFDTTIRVTDLIKYANQLCQAAKGGSDGHSISIDETYTKTSGCAVHEKYSTRERN